MTDPLTTGAARRLLAELREAREVVAGLRADSDRIRRFLRSTPARRSAQRREAILAGIITAQQAEIEALRAIAGGVWVPEEEG